VVALGSGMKSMEMARQDQAGEEAEPEINKGIFSHASSRKCKVLKGQRNRFYMDTYIILISAEPRTAD
jgi:hypothetical protein